MEYLTMDNLQESEVIVFNNEKLMLIESAGNILTYIDDADDKESGDKIDTSAKVFIRQRWKVDVLPADKFSKHFITHRYICAYYCTYGELLKEQEKIYTAWEVLPHNEINYNDLSDNFDNLF